MVGVVELKISECPLFNSIRKSPSIILIYNGTFAKLNQLSNSASLTECEKESKNDKCHAKTYYVGYIQKMLKFSPPSKL